MKIGDETSYLLSLQFKKFKYSNSTWLLSLKTIQHLQNKVKKR